MSGSASPFSVNIQVVVGSVQLPVMSFQVTSGSYGSVGHATITLTISMLDARHIDLVEVSSSGTTVPVAIYAATAGRPPVKIFDGDVLSTEWDFDNDVVTLHARDHAAIFVDQRRILTRDATALVSALQPLSPGQVLTPQGVSTINRKVSQVVADIATDFGYTPVVQMGPGTDITAGASYGGGDHAYMTIPQNLWSILNTLAKDTGNEIYTTPDRRLVFGVPGQGLPTLGLTYKLPPGQGPPGSVPVARLVVNHNPRRNGTFRVLVTSYDQARATSTIGRATYIGSNLSSPGLPEGLRVGSDAQAADGQLLKDAATKGEGSPRDLSHVQLYTFHWDGMTNEDANSRAGAIATDISKRLLLMAGRLEGTPELRPTQPIQVSANTLSPVFTRNTYYVSGYTHRFTMPGEGSGRGGRWDGFYTDFHSLDLPSTALAGTVR